MKAQMKMGESIMILIIFFFLLVFGVVFYAKYAVVTASGKQTENAGLQAIQIVQKVQFLPEIQCSVEGTIDYNCIDLMKLMALNDLAEDEKRIYSTMFPRTVIIAVEIYPEKHSWKVYGEDAAKKKSRFFPVPVVLFNATSNQYHFGYLNITVLI